MGKFRKKPVVIEAIRFTGDNTTDVMLFAAGTVFLSTAAKGLRIGTLENPDGESLLVSPGDWVIRGVKGEFYPCKPDIFEATYEPV